ncbi:hypothetical protein JB92DRAFT_2826974 [Gautieria morchelliformis]|nr:hypothetical protein JB92DRAFT_2826974 [Gautieria morchelliformis]
MSMRYPIHLFSPTAVPPYSQFITRIVKLSDQQASIFFQQELKIAEATERKKVVDAVIYTSIDEWVWKLGCATLFGTSWDKSLNLPRIATEPMLCRKHWTVRRMFRLLIVSELLLGDPFSTLLNKHSAHVWSKIIWALLAPPIFAYVNKSLAGKWVSLACHETGSLIVQTAFEQSRMALPSFTSTLLDESLHPDAKIDKEMVQNMAAMAYAAGAALHPPSSLYPLNIYHRSMPHRFRFRSMNVSGALYGRHGAPNYV